MSQENLQAMIMQNFGGVKEVYYEIVQVLNERLFDMSESLTESLKIPNELF